jgi:beta-phosphoglucomutase
MKHNFKAILFDMDGTLVDSMNTHIAAWKQAFAESGFYPDELEFYLNEGVKHPITVRDRLKKLGIDNPDEELVRKIYTRKREIFEEIVVMKPTEGVLELLGNLRGRVQLGIVTGGVRSIINKIVPALFDNYFDIIVDYECTEKGKPDPEPYRYALKQIGLPEKNVLAVENAPTGIASAVDAGIECWAVCTTLEPKYLARAQRIFKDFKELGAALLNEIA